MMDNADHKEDYPEEHDRQEPEISRKLLGSVFDEMPPDVIVKAVNPGSRAIHRIMAGVILNAVTLEFFDLNYILPAIGMILLVLGFRTFRRENLWFRMAYICSLIRMTAMAGSLIMNATIYGEGLEEAAGIWIRILLWGIWVIILLAFRKATDLLQEKAAAQEKSHSAAALFLWYLVLLLLEVLAFGGIVALLVMIVVFFMIVLSMDQLAALMERENYLIQAAPVKISDGLLAAAISGIIVIGMVCGYRFFSAYPMKWTQTDLTVGEEEETYDHLLTLGYPKDQLDDLAPEELEKLKDADLVLVSSDEEEVYSDGVGSFFTTAEVKNGLKTISVAVRLSENGTDGVQWRVIHHFSVSDALPQRGTSNISISPGMYHTDVEDLSGRLLCRENGTDLTADFVSLQYCSYTRSEEATDISLSEEEIQCDFSLPAQAEDRRCYAAYTVVQTDPEMTGFLSTFFYTYQAHWFQYPVGTAGDYVRKGIRSSYDPYLRTDGSGEFFFTEDGKSDQTGG